MIGLAVRFELDGQPTGIPQKYRYPQSSSTELLVSASDAAAPSVSGLALSTDPVTPNGDAWADTLSAAFTLDGGRADVTLEVRRSDGTLLAVSENASRKPGGMRLSVPLTAASGEPLSDGRYRCVVVASNASGRTSASAEFFVSRDLYTAPSLGTEPDLRSATARATTSGVEFTIDITAASYVTVKAFSGKGLVRTIANNAERSAGKHVFTWDGRDEAGRSLQAGNYAYYVFITSGGTSPRTDLFTGVTAIGR